MYCPIKLIYVSVLEKRYLFEEKTLKNCFNVFIISGGFYGNLSVVCGSPLATESTTTTATTTATITAVTKSTTTMIAIPPLATSRLSSLVSSTEPTSAIT